MKCSYARWSVRNVRRYGERAERDDTASVWRDHHHRAPSPSARRCASSRRRPTRTLETRRTHGSFRNLGPCVVGLAARLDPLQTRPHRLFPTQRYASDDDDDARARRRRPRLCWRSVWTSSERSTGAHRALEGARSREIAHKPSSATARARRWSLANATLTSSGFV